MSHSKRKEVTKLSGHVAPGMNPAITPAPPMTPPPTPTPFIYVAKSASAIDLGKKFRFSSSRAEVVTVNSVMNVELPGNKLGQTPGTGDVVTHVIEGKAAPLNPEIKPSRRFFSSEDLPVCIVNDPVKLNLMTKNDELCQSIGRFMPEAQFMKKMATGKILAGIEVITAGEPVAIATGDVVDDICDFELVGAPKLSWWRSYSTARRLEAGPLGIGGWTHSLHQYILRDGEHLTVRLAGGLDAVVALPKVGSEVVVRRLRLTILRKAEDKYEVRYHGRGVTAMFDRAAEQAVARLSGFRDDNDRAVRCAYEGDLLVLVEAAGGRHVELAYDDRRRISKITTHARGAPQFAFEFAYAPSGELACVTTPRGDTEEYRYDDHHRMIAKKREDGRRFYYRYDFETGKCIHTSGDGGLHGFDFEYGDGVTYAEGNPAGRIYEVDARGAVVRESTYDRSFVRARAYDEEGLVVSEANANGDTWSYRYDDLGNLIEAVAPSGAKLSWRFDADGRLMAWKDGDGAEYSIERDTRGNIVRLSDGRRWWVFEHDEAGRAVAEHHSSGASSWLDYDDEGNVERVRFETGAYIEHERDALGRVIAMRDSIGRITRFEYDVLGAVAKITSPEETDISFRLGASGRTEAVTTAAGRTTEYSWCGSASIESSRDSSGAVWRTKCDVNELPREIVNPDLERWEVRYDRAKHPVETRTFDGRVLRYRWNNAGRISRVEYPDGSFREFEYDDAGLVVADRTPDGERRFEYASGRLLRAVAEGEGTTIETVNLFDQHGRIIEQATAGMSIRFEYDDRGRRRRILPNGEATEYRWGAHWHLEELNHGGARVTFRRDAFGRELARAWASGAASIATTWDAMNRPRTQHVRRGTEVLAQRCWAYNLDGGTARVEDTRWGDIVFRHDARGYLVGFDAQRGHESYGRDATGRLTHVGGDGDYGVRTGNVLLRQGSLRYGYDERARRIERRDPQGDTCYRWDDRDQLREVSSVDGTTVRFEYDAFGRRVRKVVSTSEGKQRRQESYWWDFEALAGVAGDDGALRTFVAHPGAFFPICEARDGEARLYVLDRVGRPTEVIDAEGRVVWSGCLDPFGNILAETGDHENASPFRNLGGYYDAETRLTYYRHRYFDTEVCRWLSPDPANLKGGADVFGYEGDPTVVVDPRGLGPESCPQYGRIKFHFDAQGRTCGVDMRVTQRMREADAGSPSDPRMAMDAGFQRGHVGAYCLGGPGEIGDYGDKNIVPLSPGANRDMLNFENTVAREVDAGRGPIDYSVAMNLPSEGNRPTEIAQQASYPDGTPVVGPGGQTVVVTPNP